MQKEDCEYRICYTTPDSIFYSEKHKDGLLLVNGSNGIWYGNDVQNALGNYLKHIDPTKTVSKGAIQTIDKFLKTRDEQMPEHRKDDQEYYTIVIRKTANQPLQILPVINTLIIKQADKMEQGWTSFSRDGLVVPAETFDEFAQKISQHSTSKTEEMQM